MEFIVARIRPILGVTSVLVSYVQIEIHSSINDAYVSVSLNAEDVRHISRLFHSCRHSLVESRSSRFSCRREGRFTILSRSVSALRIASSTLAFAARTSRSVRDIRVHVPTVNFLAVGESLRDRQWRRIVRLIQTMMDALKHETIRDYVN